MTDLFLWTLVAAALVWEIYTLLNKAEGDHITARVRKAAKHPLFVLAVGILMGHFFWCDPCECIGTGQPDHAIVEMEPSPDGSFRARQPIDAVSESIDAASAREE